MSTQRPPLLSTAKGAFRGNAPIQEMSKQERAARKIKIHLRSSLRPFEGGVDTQMSNLIRRMFREPFRRVGSSCGSKIGKAQEEKRVPRGSEGQISRCRGRLRRRGSIWAGNARIWQGGCRRGEEGPSGSNDGACDGVETERGCTHTPAHVNERPQAHVYPRLPPGSVTERTRMLLNFFFFFCKANQFPDKAPPEKQINTEELERLVILLLAVIIF